MSHVPLSLSAVAPITSVVVYRDRALIRRQGTLTLAAGEMVIDLAGLPALQADSLRVQIRGAAPVQIWEVRSLSAPAPEPDPAVSQALLATMQTLAARLQVVQDEITALQLQLEMVAKLSTAAIAPLSRQVTQGLAEAGQLPLAQVETWLTFIGDRQRDYAAQRAASVAEAQDLEQRLQELKSQLSQAQARPLVKGEQCLRLRLMATAAGPVELHLSYLVLVDTAGWLPQYDVYLDLARSQLELVSLAEVTQKTEAPWTAIALSLSTEQPWLNPAPPALEPWALSRGRTNRVIRPQAHLPVTSPMPLDDQTLGGAAGSELSTQQRRQANRSMPSQEMMTWPLTHLMTLSNDGLPHRVVIAQAVYPCELKYVACPRQVSFAYLQVEFTPPPDRGGILSGQAYLFQAGDFAGTTHIGSTAAGDRLILNVGFDAQVPLRRRLVSHQSEATQTDDPRQRLRLRYAITVTNRHDFPITLTVMEALPTSQEAALTVSLLDHSPTVSSPTADRLEWRLTLDPQQDQELYYTLALDHGPEIELASLNLT